MLKPIPRLLFTLLLLPGLLSAQPYDDGLPRSTPEAEGIPSEVIARFYRALDEGGYG